jgi:hypothetical protein
MKNVRKCISKSASFDLRVLISLFVVSAAVFVALFAIANPSERAVDPALAEGSPTPTLTPGTVLYDQYDNFATDKTPNIPSQDAETALDFFDSQAADDFIVPAGESWQITEVDVLGEYDSTGPAASFHVFFYENGAGDLPGLLVASRLENPFTGSNDFVITLAEPVTLPEGHYWVSVQARQDITQAGFWLWHNRTLQANFGAAWQNPGNGFGTGCVVWIRRVTCAVLQQTAPDQVFRLIGTAGGGTPTPTPTPPTTTPRPTPTPRHAPTPRSRPTPHPRFGATPLRLHLGQAPCAREVRALRATSTLPHSATQAGTEVYSCTPLDRKSKSLLTFECVQCLACLHNVGI